MKLDFLNKDFKVELHFGEGMFITIRPLLADTVRELTKQATITTKTDGQVIETLDDKKYDLLCIKHCCVTWRGGEKDGKDFKFNAKNRDLLALKMATFRNFVLMQALNVTTLAIKKAAQQEDDEAKKSEPTSGAD